MSSHTFSAFIDVGPSSTSEEANPIPSVPQKTKPRLHHSVQPIQDPVELDNLQWGSKLNGPVDSGTACPSGYQTPRAPTDLEMSRPTTPENDQGGVDALQSFSNPPMNRFRMLSVCLMNFGCGLNDSAPGALIPYIEKYYSIGYAIVSLFFITMAVGFISAALIVDALRARLGRARTLMVSQALLACGLAMILCTPPFPVVVFAFFFIGLGEAIYLAMGSTFVVNLQNGTHLLGAMHGSYGLGATIGPLVATAMVSAGRTWSRYYLLPLSVTIFNLVLAGWSFWHFEKESNPTLLTSVEQSVSQPPNTSNPTNHVKDQMASMVQAFKSKTVILGALFIFAYEGAEVSISGWVLSFLITTRHGNPASVGYVTSGFWGGITLGRFLLSHPAHKIGEKLFVYCLIVGAAAFQLLVWLVPNIVGDAVAVSIVGLLLGPVFPCGTTVFSKLIPKKDQVSGLSIISAFGSSGGAVAPFTTGLLAQAVGTFVLHPIAIVLFAVMLVTWFTLPATPRKRTD